jgi:methyl-accepting chemotaxis protein
MRGTTQDLVGETARLTAAARAGDLAVRGDSARFEGAFRAVVEGTNQTLDGLKALTDEARAQRDVAALFITEVGEVLGRTAAGDLTARVHGTYQGDHAEIQRALNSALGTLDDALTQVSSAAGEVSEAAGQITHGAQSLSEGASSQAAQLEEVSASLHELSAVTQRNSEGAARALTLTNGARQSIEEGAAAVERLAGAMSELQQASGATAKIVRTIDEIAFQTNLLALNAAVEAARAGDAGRGFAVVAEEVRALARRSAEAAQQTATLIQESVLQARSGAAINADVLASFNAINERAAQVGVVVAEITSACEEQAQGVAQISTAVERMNDVTQQVASAAEQSASAATEMASQSNGLAEMVGGFHLTGQTPPDDSPSRVDAVAAEPPARHRRKRRRAVATA